MNRKTNISVVLFWGALWGILEATLGWVFHLIPVPGLSGTLMFPMAFVLMWAAYQKTGKANTVFFVALVAAAFKLCDFAFAFGHPVKIINPAVSIVLEGLFVWVAFRLSEKKGFRLVAFSAASALMWRIGFLAYQSLMNQTLFWPTLFAEGSGTVLSFVFLFGFINAVFIAAFLFLAWKKELLKQTAASFSVKPLFALILAVAAVLTEAVL